MRSQQSGFTLVEIAIVLVIIGLLLGVAVKNGLAAEPDTLIKRSIQPGGCVHMGRVVR